MAEDDGLVNEYQRWLIFCFLLVCIWLYIVFRRKRHIEPGGHKQKNDKRHEN